MNSKPIPRMHPEVEPAYDAMAQADAAYFEANPGKSYYVRPMTYVERMDARSRGTSVVSESRMLVYNLATGMRFRQMITHDAEIPKRVKLARKMQQQICKQRSPRSRPKGFSNR